MAGDKESTHQMRKGVCKTALGCFNKEVQKDVTSGTLTMRKIRRLAERLGKMLLIPVFGSHKTRVWSALNRGRKAVRNRRKRKV